MLLATASKLPLLPMLARAIPLCRASSTCRNSSSLPSYHPKVRAIPFAFPPGAAVTHVCTTAAIATQTYSPSIVKDGVSRLVNSFLAKYFSSASFDVIQPERVQALYYPSWYVDAEVEGKAWLSADLDDPPENIIVHFKHAELPGFGMDLGRISIRDENLTYESAKPFSPSLSCQHGLDILCLPYNISPLDLITRARDLSFGPTKVDENFRFDPRSIKFKLVAAYPILLPVYVFQYVPRGLHSRVTIIVEAHSQPGRHYVHFVGGSDLKELVAREIFDAEDFVAQGVSASSCRFAPRVIAHPGASEDLCSWMTSFLEDREAPQRLISSQPVDLSDHRVREWTEKEVLPVHNWLKLGEEVVHLRRMIEAISSVKVERIKVFEFPPRRSSDSKEFVAGLEGFFKMEAEKLRKLEEIRASQTPAWWRKWEDGQKKPS